MEARAIKKHIPSSPVKMRLVVDMIRGKKVAEAIGILHFHPKSAASIAELTLKSAISNLNNKIREAGEHTNEEEYFIKEAKVDVGPVIKRIMPAPMGRAFRIRKRSNHLTIVVSDGNNSNNEKE